MPTSARRVVSMSVNYIKTSLNYARRVISVYTGSSNKPCGCRLIARLSGLTGDRKLSCTVSICPRCNSSIRTALRDKCSVHRKLVNTKICTSRGCRHSRVSNIRGACGLLGGVLRGDVVIVRCFVCSGGMKREWVRRRFGGDSSCYRC